MLADVSLSLRFGDIVNSDRSGGEYWVIRGSWALKSMMHADLKATFDAAAPQC